MAAAFFVFAPNIKGTEMSENLKKLQEARLKLAAELKAHADARKPDENGNEPAEWRTEWDRINKSYDDNKTALDAELKAIDDQNAITERLNAIDADLRRKPHALIGRDGGRIEDGPRNGREFGGEDRDEQRALALQGWMRCAHNSEDVGEVTDEHRAAAKACGITLSPTASVRIKLHNNFGEVRNALSGQTGGSGGFTYGETFVASLERAMLAFGGMLQVASVIRTATAEPMRWPTATDTANSGRQIGESAAVASLDPTFSQMVLGAYKFTSDEILVPFELLRDNAVNLASVLSDMLGERLGRIQNTKYTTGTGAATPWGIVTKATAGVTSASSTAISFDEVIDLEHTIDPSRRKLAGVGYMFHDSILKALRKLKDGNGLYLWQAGTNSGAPDTLNTHPYTINQDMASSIASGAITMLFGQLTAYKIRQVNSVRLYRLVERFRENDQDAFLAFVEGDGNLLDAGDNPVKKLTQV